MTNQSKGRVGVAPSRERCPVCGDRAALEPNMDGERMCPPCCDIYVHLVAENNAAIERELLGHRETEEPGNEPPPAPRQQTAWPANLIPLITILLQHESATH